MLTKFEYLYICRRYKIQYTRGTIAGHVWYPRVDSKKIHVVLLNDLSGLGKKGQIVETSRGYANHNLIPEGIAVYANWQNIDLYADPKLNTIDYTQSAQGEPKTPAPRLSNYNIFTGSDLKLNFTAPTLIDNPEILCSPITLSKVLDTFAKQHNIDILSSQIIKINAHENKEFEYKGNDTIFYNVGKYEVIVRFPLHEKPENDLVFEIEIKTVNLDEAAKDDPDIDSPKFQLHQ